MKNPHHAVRQLLSCALIVALTSLAVLPVHSTVVGQDPEIIVSIPDGTEFEVETLEEISSKTATEGDPVNFRVADDVTIAGRVVIKERALVKGTVSNAEKSGRMGRSGKLGIRVESTIATDGQKVRLRASRGKEGDDKTGTVIALSLLVSPLFLLKRGKDAKVKPGTKIKVYTDDEVKVRFSD